MNDQDIKAWLAAERLAAALIDNYLKKRAPRDLERKIKRKIEAPRAVIGEGSWRVEIRIPSQIAITLLTGIVDPGEA